MHALRAIALLATVVAVAFPAAASAEYDTVLVSRLGLTGPAGNNQSFERPAISANGRFIAFETVADNFGGGAPNSARIYLKNTVTGDVTLVSRQDGPDGAPLGGNDPEISRDGRFVCWIFTSVTVRDVVGNTTRTAPGVATQGEEGHPEDLTGHGCAIANTGDRVAYVTAEAHVPEDTNGRPDVYVYDFSTSSWTLVSRNSAGAVGDGESRSPAMTPDGRFVAFWSRATNLDPADTDATADVYVRDLSTGTTRLVSRPSGTAASPAPSTAGFGSYDAALSDDGRFVAFSSWRPFATGATGKQVYERDMSTGTTTLVSRGSGSLTRPGQGLSENPSVTPDGRYVAFDSLAPDLDVDSVDGPTAYDVFVRDVIGDRTTLVSRASGVFGAAGDQYSFSPAIAADNTRVAFASRAENFSPDDVAAGDVFYRDTVGSLGKLPADLPGLPTITAAKAGTLTLGSGARAAAGPSIAFRFTLSEFAQTQILIDRTSSGRRKGSSCVKPTAKLRKAKPCTRYRPAGSLDVVGQEGKNSIPFDGRVKGRLLKPGTYRARIVGVDFDHNRGKATAVTFKVVSS